MKTDQGPPAVKIRLHNSFVDQTQWLMEKDPSLGSVSMGPATLRFTDELLKESRKPAPEQGYLEIKFGEKSSRIPLEEGMKLPATFPLEGTEYRVEILRLFRNAAVMGRELVDQESERDNRAAEILLLGEDVREAHTVFAKFPEFPTMHGLQPSQAGARIFYRVPNSGSRGETHELRFVQRPEGLIYQIQDGFEVRSAKANVGETVETGWMDLKFVVQEFFEHAKFARSYLEEPNTAEGDEIYPAIRLKAEASGQTKEFWLGQGFVESVEIGETNYSFLYGQRRIPAGFRIELKDFRVENYPGTNRPASFESDVVLIDDSRGVVRDVTISMNEPLIYRGYRIYQSGYTLAPGQPDVSIFSVGRDPGVPLHYVGTLVMIGGILIMFYTRRFSTNAGRLP